jgi:hypothetical protein
MSASTKLVQRYPLKQCSRGARPIFKARANTIARRSVRAVVIAELMVDADIRNDIQYDDELMMLNIECDEFNDYDDYEKYGQYTHLV